MSGHGFVDGDTVDWNNLDIVAVAREAACAIFHGRADQYHVDLLQAAARQAEEAK